MERKSKLALVTGGNRGIGYAVAKQLVESGCDVIITSRNLNDGLKAATEIGPKIIALKLDVTDEVSVTELKSKIETTYGKLDILVNNAGVSLDPWVSGMDMDMDFMKETYETNVFGLVRCCQAFLPAMIKAGSGRVVNVSSELGSVSTDTVGKSLAYRSSKTAVNAVTRFLAAECNETPDIKINAACPGWVRTALGGPDAPRSREEGADTIVWLATLPADGPTGGLFRDREPYPW